MSLWEVIAKRDQRLLERKSLDYQLHGFRSRNKSDKRNKIEQQIFDLDKEILKDNSEIQRLERENKADVEKQALDVAEEEAAKKAAEEKAAKEGAEKQASDAVEEEAAKKATEEKAAKEAAEKENTQKTAE
ncbi:hypothetical protein VC83_03592 [Pseudogymnoascus destructans]|uniref:Uncharacterized protein n=1 Tax=Pseudogymnoascus destructans TaxID=655981 RepID=A0A177AGY1_9PEZI|nr:uncharacterized protein VC83_03592 [Pseudogymnoascus destructans]OAF60444.1 hypothetical protein VC83_03592 [Pseudogymnoascus destructans]